MHMSKNMSHCFLCGAEYEVCKMCKQIKQYTPWRQECDTAHHWQIYSIVKDLRRGVLKADEAKEQLDHLKVTIDEVKTFVPSVQETLLPLYSKTKLKSKRAETIIVDEAVVTEEETENI